jgi:hypothetical protein
MTKSETGIGLTAFNIRRDKFTDERVSVCIDCKKGIFKGTGYVWTSRGLVHNECEELKKNETEHVA